MASREALVLAAGLGTRLGPVTDVMPKALVPVGGVPMLEHVARRLIDAGVDRLVINTHHFADQITEFVREKGDFGISVEFSHEPDRPLETGGGLKEAVRFLRLQDPFFVHNADILTDLPLDRMYRDHQSARPLATLAVMHRESSRYLLFDDLGLMGRVDQRRNIRIEVRAPVGEIQGLAFGGVHVVSPQFPDLLSENGRFSIFDPYLRLSRAGHRIRPFLVDDWDWIDIGSPGRLAEANVRVEGSTA